MSKRDITRFFLLGWKVQTLKNNLYIVANFIILLDSQVNRGEYAGRFYSANKQFVGRWQIQSYAAWRMAERTLIERPAAQMAGLWDGFP